MSGASMHPGGSTSPSGPTGALRATPGQWVAGARPRTLPAAIAPVLIGAGTAIATGAREPIPALLALVVALALQVGVNYANDYSDGIRGTDEARVGPVRLVGQRLAEPRAVKRAAFLCFGVACLAGLALMVVSRQWWLLPTGIAAVVAAWFYTGGSRPYGYLGLGEVFVFVFFGLVATIGTCAGQLGAAGLGAPGLAAWAGAVGVGALSCAILMANNLRDIPSDRVSSKMTVAARIGDAHARTAYLVLVAAGAVAALVGALEFRGALLGLLAFVVAVPPVRAIRSGANGRDLVPVLAGTGMLTLAYGACFGLGVVLLHG